MPTSIRKILISIVIGVFLIFVAGYIVFKIIFSPKRLKNSFQQIIAGTLNRNVSIGEAELRFGNLVLKDIKVDFKKENDLTKEFRNFIECEKVQIKFKILPLLKKKFVFREVRINSPVLNIGHQPTVKIAGLIGMIKEPVIGNGIRFGINRLSVEKGSINLLPPVFSNLRTKDIDFQIKGTTLDKPVEVSLNCKFDGSKFDEINLLGTVNFFRAIAEIKKFEIYGSGGKIDISGEINKILTDPQMDLSYNFSEWPYKLMPENLTISGKPSLKGKIKSEAGKIYVNWKLDLSSCKIDYGELYQKNEKSGLKFQGGLMHRNVFTSLNWYVIEWNGTTVSGTGSISDGSLDINVRGELMDLKNLTHGLKFIEKYVGGGELSIKGKIGGNIKSGNFSGKIDINDLKIKKIKGLSNLYSKITGTKKYLFNMGKVNIDILVDDKELKINNLNAKGGDIEGWGKGYYIWDEEINFVAYPKIYGKEIGFQIHGSTDNIEVILK